MSSCIFKTLVLTVAIIVTSPMTARAQQDVGDVVQATISLRPGFVALIDFPKPFRTIHVGDPEIADVGPPQSDRRVTIHARKIGSTNIIAQNEAGDVIFEANIIVGRAEAGRTQVHNRPVLSAYTPYLCTPHGCRRIDDPQAGPLDQPVQTTPNTTIVINPAPRPQ